MKRRIFIFLAVVILFASCSDKEPTSWSTYFNNTGTYSSPRLVDLNGDGTLDIVIGAGGKEEQHSDTAVLAIDGVTGKALWAIGGSNQYVGSAVFTDINGDQLADIVIGGRWAQLSALDGRSGKLLWTFYPGRSKPDGSDGGWYNFTTPQLVPDQDGDGIADLLVANGGDARAAAGDGNRPAGRLLVLSARTGQLLADATVPDKKETYLSVVCEPAGRDLLVYFGTGGETIGGHLYRTRLSEIMAGDISRANVLASSQTNGFIGSPVLTDITSDGINDIIVNAVDGRMLAINGKTDTLLWEVSFPGTEAYTVPAPGYFNKDSIPDFFSNFAIGRFPVLNWSVRFMVDGKTGRIEYQDTIPAFQYASPVSADIDGDGVDEAIIHQSGYRRRQFDAMYYSNLLAFDFNKSQKTSLHDTLRATNLASTPWIGDMDNDGYIDIVYAAVNYHDLKFDLEKPLGLWVARFRSKIPVKRPTRWGGYLGTKGEGRF